MKITNILLAGVGGQGLVLTTHIISEAAFRAGMDVKTNDVVGLAQRGGKVFGSVRCGEKVHSPNVPVGEGNFLLALEPLEGQRLAYLLRAGGKVIMNTKEIPPTLVLMEKEEYPSDVVQKLQEQYVVECIDATAEGEKLGNTKIANTFLVGMLARELEIPKEIWLEVIRENVPEKYVAINEQAFEVGFAYTG